MTTPPSDTIDLSSAAHMGDLARGGTTWSVYLETRLDGPITAGRVHFVAGDVAPNGLLKQTDRVDTGQVGGHHCGADPGQEGVTIHGSPSTNH